MKLLLVHNHYLIPGGEDTVFSAECAMLRRAGHTVITYEKSNASLPSGNPLRLFASTIWNRDTTREIDRIIQAEHPDIVHCHNTFPLISPSIYWICARRRVPVIQTLHNYRLACLNGYLYRDGAICNRCLGHAPLPGVCRKCYRDSLPASATVAIMLLFHRLIGTFRHKVTRYIALTESARQRFIKVGLPADKIAVKPNFVPIPNNLKSKIPDSSSRLLRDGTVCHHVLYAGRLSPEKGPDILIEAWKRLPKANIALEFAGDGPMRQSLEALAADSPYPIIFLGQLDRAALNARMQSALALVLPTRAYETFGLSVLEANALGTPAIVSEQTVSAELIIPGQTGLLFHPGDSADLAAKISELLAHPFRVTTPIPHSCTEQGNLSLLQSIYQSALP